MTVPVQTPVSNHVGNGITTSFPYAFRLLDAVDITVTVDGVEKTLNIDYTVTGVGVESGGAVVFAAAPASLSAIALIRQVPINRLTDYQYSGDFQSPTVNNDFDRIVMMLQDSGLALANTLRLPPGDAASGVLPDAAGRALKGLAFDASGAIFLTAASGNADVLAAALGSNATAALGGGLVGYDGTKNYVAGTIGKGIKDAAAAGAQGIADAATAASAAAAASTNTNGYKADVASVADVTKGAALMGYKLNAAGTVGRALTAKLLERVSVKDFGAVGDGVADDTSAIQAAVNWAQSAANREIHFPAGRYNVSSTITVTPTFPGFLSFKGAGRATTIVHAVVGPLFQFNGTMDYLTVSDLRILSSTAKSNKLHAGFYFPDGNTHSDFVNVTYDSDSNATMGASFYYCEQDKTNDTVSFVNCIAICRTCCYQIGAGSSIFWHGGRCIGQWPTVNGTGILFTGGNGGCWMWATDTIQLEYGVRVQRLTATSNREIFAVHAAFDSCRINFSQEDQSYVSILGCWAASAKDYGIQFAGESDAAIMTISGGTVFNSGGGAVGGGASIGLRYNGRGALFCNGVVFRNNLGRAIYCENDLPSVYGVIENCQFRDNGANGDYQVYLTGNKVFRNNYLNVAASGASAVQRDITGRSRLRISNNIGFQGISLVTPPSFPASGVAATNDTGVAATLYLRGGTATSVQKNGTFIYDIVGGGNANVNIRLRPGDTFTVNYTVAPSATWDFE